MNAKTLPRITADKLAKLGDKVLLIDIRSESEYRREHLANAACISPDALAQRQPENDKTQVFYCLSGMRTARAEAILAESAGEQQAYILEGGLQAWKKAGLPTEINHDAPLDLMRQVQIGAGSLVLIGVLAGWLILPAFYLIAAFVGAGLLMAGLTGFCGMAKLLGLMPWNKQ